MSWFKSALSDDRQTTVSHNFSQYEGGWRLTVSLHEPWNNFDGRTWKTRIRLHHTWDRIPSTQEVDDRIAILTAEIWEAYRVYQHANRKN